MKKVFKGDFVITYTPLRFQHKHLSLQKQRKDKQIKQEREELQKKRKQFQEVKARWTKQQIQYKTYAHTKKEQNTRLVQEDKALKIELFRLSIRRDQIESRINPNITIQKAKIIKRYLRCVSYTAGKKLQSIKFWKSQSRYENLKFLLNLAVDRFFGRSPIQRQIIGNLSRIVFCKKIKFQEEWAILCVKESQSSHRYSCKTSAKEENNPHPKEQKIFEVMVYAVTGKYFHFSKKYTDQQLKEWADTISRLQLPKIPARINQHRLSVADNLAKLNALRVLGSQMIPFEPNNQNINSDEFKMISEEIVSGPNSEINETDEENSSQRAEEKKTNTENQSDLSQANQSQPQSVKGKPATADKMKTNEKLGTREIKTNARFRTKKEVKTITRKELNTKSSFFIKSKSEPQTCKLNHSFLMGSEQLLFPAMNPTLNVVILKQTKQVFILQDYLQVAAKRLIIDKAVARYRLKMKIKAQLKKCLYYKKQVINVCYETIMTKERAISLPCLFVLKVNQTPQKFQIYISCDSILIHPLLQNGLQIKALFHSYQKQKQEPKEEKETRGSNLKNIKNSSRKSRDSKLRSQIKHISRVASIHHQKSSFVQKKVKQTWTPFSAQTIKKFQLFLQKHVISLRKRTFVTQQSINSAIRSCAKIQRRMKCFLSKKSAKKAMELFKVKAVCRSNPKILVSAVLQVNEKKVRLFFQQFAIEPSYSIQFYDYEAINWEAICKSLNSNRFEGAYKHLRDSLLDLVAQNIEKQTKRREKLQKEKPQRYRRMVQSFLFMIGLRNRARKNIFFIKRQIIRDRIFVLLIRRDRYVRSLLECNLYDLICEKKEDNEVKNTESTFGRQQRQVGSEYGSNKARSRWKPQFDDKIYRYQKIYLMEQYFRDIDYKNIWDEFYIDKGVFLLKPPKTQNIYYIQRLATLDLNSQEFFKELTNYEKKDNLLKINDGRLDPNLSRSSYKKLINKNASQITSKTNTQSKEALNVSKMKGRNQSKLKKQKKTSIQYNKKQMVFLKSSFQKQNFRNSQMVSKKSFGESNSCKAGRQILQIKDNSHESMVYYSLYKEEGIFFYIQLFTVSKTYHERGYSQELVSLAKERLEKKQLQEANFSLFYMKLAAWAHDNDDQFIRIQEIVREKNDQSASKKDQGSISNLVTIQFFNALIGGSKRFSFQNSIVLEKGPRTNTLIL